MAPVSTLNFFLALSQIQIFTTLVTQLQFLLVSGLDGPNLIGAAQQIKMIDYRLTTSTLMNPTFAVAMSDTWFLQHHTTDADINSMIVCLYIS